MPQPPIPKRQAHARAQTLSANLTGAGKYARKLAGSTMYDPAAAVETVMESGGDIELSYICIQFRVNSQ